MSRDNLIQLIADAGIVGCGGAGFPTDKKLSGHFEYLIVNAAECEPLLRTDRFLMLNRANEIVKALKEVKEAVNAEHCVIAVKEHYHDEIKSLQTAVAAEKADIEIKPLGNFYPAGDEQTIVHEVTGRIVPPGGIPAAVGTVIINTATANAIYDAMNGKPLIHKYLTVTGEVKHPVVLCVPIGTSFKKCIELAGGPAISHYYAINGGPVMGRSVAFEDIENTVVTKTTSGIIVLPDDCALAAKSSTSIRTMARRASAACIQCSFCTQLCPRHLMGHPIEPHKIMRALAAGGDIQSILNLKAVQNAAFCCECGVCEIYACPMGLQPRRINSAIKKELSRAKIRPEKPEGECIESPEREYRKVPSRKMAARASVDKYYDYEIRELVTCEPERVEIPVSMHIGAPDIPVVKEGDRVHAGDLIAAPANGALGANIHSSIDGYVRSVGERIIIENN